MIARALGRSQPQVHRYGDGAEQQAGVERLGERQTRGQGDRDALSAERAARAQLACAETRRGVQLGVGPAPVRGVERDPRRVARTRHG